MNWIEGTVSYDLSKNRFIRHITFDEVKLILVYHRLYEDMFSIDEIRTIDGTNIINLVRDRTIERLENIIERVQNEI